jgi:4-hydroxybenzoate polyprenyltransferase
MVMRSAAAKQDAGASRAANVASLEFARAYLITMRPYLLFVSGITGIAGMALAPQIGVVPTVLLGGAFFLAYGFGQAMTDCFQVDTDSLSAPYRPLVKGVIRRRDVIVVSLAGLTAIGLFVSRAHPLNILLALLCVAGLVTYTYFKRRWWGGPFYNAWIVAVLLLIGTVSVYGIAAVPLTLSATLLWTVAAAFFGYANFVIAGYFKDVSADRATGYDTFPVHFGMRAASWVSDGFAILAVAAAALAVAGSYAGGTLAAHHWVAAAFLSAGVWASLLAQIRLHGVTHDSEAHQAIAPVVHAYILLLSAVAVAHKPDWALPLVIFYAGYVLVLRCRPMREQI